MTPKLLDIATLDVITIEEHFSLHDAIELMKKHNIRDIVVVRASIHRYGLLTAQDLIRFKLSGISFETRLNDLKLDTIPTLHQHKSLMDAFDEMEGLCKCLCLIDDEENLTGFITYTDIITSIDPAVLMREQKLRDILWETMVRQTSHTTPTSVIFEMIYSEGYDSVVIYKEHEAVGIITTKDVVRLLHAQADLNAPIEAYMSQPLVTVNENITIAKALDFLKEKRFKRVIIRNDQGVILGQISQSELLAKVYSRWAENLKKRDQELESLNRVLEEKATRYERMAQVDKLTGLYNRSKFEKSIFVEIERAQRYGELFSIILFDIDHFKQVNDTFGHLVGDSCLQQVAKLVHNNIRTMDILARWGGEEFVIVLPKTALEDAVHAAEKFRSVIHGHLFEGIGRVTCSFGVAQYMADDTITSLVHRADTAMYKAKLKGRNKVASCMDS